MLERPLQKPALDRTIDFGMASRFLFALIALTLACGTGTELAPPDPDVRVMRSRDTLLTVQTTVSVLASVLNAGDSTELVLQATNTGPQRVQIGVQCGPSLDAVVQYPSSAEQSALLEFVGPAGAFPCPLLPSHFADPGQTQTERIPWKAPNSRGVYYLRAGLRRSDGLGNVSAPVAVTVR